MQKLHRQMYSQRSAISLFCQLGDTLFRSGDIRSQVDKLSEKDPNFDVLGPSIFWGRASKFPTRFYKLGLN